MGPLQQYCRDHGIELPPLPPNTHIEEVQKDVLFGTDSHKPSPRSITTFVAEALANKTDDYVLIGTAGHGTVSKAFHYYVVTDHLALFIQLHENTEPKKIKGALTCVNYFFQHMQRIQESGHPLPAGKRMVVEYSDFDENRWAWSTDSQWHQKEQGKSILYSALGELANIE